ncbi:MAG: Asp-tRNA(Asn)/Glu-tRNA(Gln) amidotransferase subunit GatB [Rhodothermia bacterium]|nr:Asp-tRNA(Asn)/Glu-tRNA(Gln) amidotransferase subunit GatB [Rhodothermia bacterium]
MDPAAEKYEAVIGLEVHCQLNTLSKAFSPEAAEFGADPNTNVDPVSLGHPGTLPILNDRVLTSTILMGLATNCRIRARSTFARKHYFYPDLPKGYQISQYEDPICHHGWIEFDVPGGKANTKKRTGITRIHIEEDAGKSIHDQDPENSLLDYNRCGVPLVELVTEPDLRSPREAAAFLQTIRQTVRYLGICDGNMEEGSLRCDANISIREAGDDSLGTKTEVKNMNSFRNVERALDYEITRQIELVESGGEVVQETRLWDAERLETRSMRSKEEAHDYRYFPDPDLVPLVVSDERIDEIERLLPEMPWARKDRLMETLSLPAYDAEIITQERSMAEMFDSVITELEKAGEEPADVSKPVSNLLMTDVLRTINEGQATLDAFPIDPVRLAALVRLRLSDTISSTGAQTLFDAMLASDHEPESLAQEMDLLQVSDAGALEPIVLSVLADSSSQVEQYLGGKEGLIGYFIGQVMRRFDGSADPKTVRSLLESELGKMRKGGSD